MYFAIFLNQNGKETPPEATKAHQQFLLDLQGKGKVILAGRMENKQGLIVCKADSKEEAQSIMAQDPFLIGQYRDMEIYEWTLSVGG